MFDSELNPHQASAVAHHQGPLLVFAGAGSGKTRVITYRIANLVATHGVPPYRILAVTFTNKAAGEMRERLGKLLGDSLARELWVGTFHATCARLLRIHGAEIGLARNFVIYDAQDQKTLMGRIVKALELDDKRYPPKNLLESVMKAKQEGKGPGDVSESNPRERVVRRVYEEYERALGASGAVDFEDLILKMAVLLSRGGPEALRIRRRFGHVLVDEFQDTNSTQYRLLRELCAEHQNLCVVGDDDQSIYRWRGADVRNIRGFQKDFPFATVVKLEQNYRSTGNIVAAALSVIGKSRERIPKALWTELPDGERVQIARVGSEREEAAHMLRVIESARREGVRLAEIAVFYRLHAQSRVLEEALRGAAVPYKIVGGLRFYERAEVKDVLSYLRVLVNPRSLVDFVRIVNTPARGIGDATLEKLGAFAEEQNLSLFDALAVLDRMKLGAGPKAKLVAFRELLAKLGELVSTLPPSELVVELLERTGYRKALLLDDSAEAESRLENLQELVSSMRDYEVEARAAGEAASLEAFLERVTLQTDGGAEGDSDDCVRLMTVHAAKGLEFDTVLVTGLEERLFPHQRGDMEEPSDLEEERRLAYVAITRARRRLSLSFADMRQIFGQTRVGIPSRFLHDIPRERVASVGASHPSIAAHQPFSQRPAVPIVTRSARPPEPPPQAGRYVDPSYCDDGAEVAVRAGTRVQHRELGDGVVRRVEPGSPPRVLAYFPGWGERKVLLSYLRIEQ